MRLQSSMRFWSLDSRSENFLPLSWARSGRRSFRFVLHEPPKCGQALQAVYHHHSSIAVFRHVKHRQGNTHEHGFDQLALLVCRPDEIALEIGVHDVAALIYPPNDILNRSVFVPDQ